jgi:guanine deaminase
VPLLFEEIFMNDTQTAWLERCIQLAKAQANSGQGGPFAALVVKNGEIIAEGCNQVTSTNDPSAHAEVVAIRTACQKLNSYQLDGCEIYSSCEPCPMCLGAIFWARPAAVYFAATRVQAAAAGFDDEFIYEQIKLGGAERRIPFLHRPVASSNDPFEHWQKCSHKQDY